MEEKYIVISIPRSAELVSFWKVGNYGYTYDYNLARKFTRDEIERKNIKIVDKDIIKALDEIFDYNMLSIGIINKIAVPIDLLSELANKSVCYAFK